MLFNEPKLLKYLVDISFYDTPSVSVLFNEPKLLKFVIVQMSDGAIDVSVLFNEPKLLKYGLLSALDLSDNLKFQCSSTSRNC